MHPFIHPSVCFQKKVTQEVRGPGSITPSWMCRPHCHPDAHPRLRSEGSSRDSPTFVWPGASAAAPVQHGRAWPLAWPEKVETSHQESKDHNKVTCSPSRIGGSLATLSHFLSEN